MTANQILGHDGLGTVGTKHADIGPTKAEEPSLNCSSLLLLSFPSLLLLGVQLNFVVKEMFYCACSEA